MIKEIKNLSSSEAKKESERKCKLISYFRLLTVVS